MSNKKEDNKSSKKDALENKILNALEEVGISADILYTIPGSSNKDLIFKIRINDIN